MSGVPAERLRGEPIAERIREDVRERVGTLRDRGTVPTLGTVLASDDPGDERFVALKHDACADLGIATRDVRVAPDAPERRLYRAVERLSADSAVDAVFVQTPLPPGVGVTDVGRRIDPEKDADCFHPENVGRLVGGDPRFVPATASAVLELLAAHDVPTEGRDAVVVGRSDAIGKPIATLLLRKARPGNATVTVCHSRTEALGEKTARADLVVTACGVPELVDGSMLSTGAVVVDVSANRVPTGPPADAANGPPADAGTRDGGELVGDVAYDSASEVCRAITPVPGGVGPVTLATLARNAVLAAERRAGVVPETERH